MYSPWRTASNLQPILDMARSYRSARPLLRDGAYLSDCSSVVDITQQMFNDAEHGVAPDCTRPDRTPTTTPSVRLRLGDSSAGTDPYLRGALAPGFDDHRCPRSMSP